MIVVLPTFWSMLQLGAWWNPPVDAIVFAVMLAVALPRALARAPRADVPLMVGLYGPAAAAAVGCGMLLAGNDGWRVAGTVLFSLGVALPVWSRRFGGAWQVAGVVATMPFLAILVHPAPIEHHWSLLGWMLLAAGTALVWALAARSLDTTLSAPPVAPAPRPAGGRKASTRMAIQLACGTGTAFAVAQWMSPEHLVWPVLTALIVHSGNHGRGDVLWKGTQRVVGALAGTGTATLLTGLLTTGNRASLVALFAILAVAAAVRPSGYGYWATGITVALAFLYGYFGESGADLLGQRLLGILAGGAVGIAAAWLVLPIRTVDVARLRVAAVLSAAGEVAAAAARGQSVTEPARRLSAAERRLASLDATARAARHLGLGAARHLDALIGEARPLAADVLAAAERPAQPDRAEFVRLAHRLGAARRRLADSKHGSELAKQGRNTASAERVPPTCRRSGPARKEVSS
jgi:uncharacterized membrane protein YccC